MKCPSCDYHRMIGPMDFSVVRLGWVWGCPVCKRLESAEGEE